MIEIIFNPDGTVTMEGHGMKGTECDVAMKEYEDALGVVTDRKNKPEYHQRTVKSSVQQKIRHT